MKLNYWTTLQLPLEILVWKENKSSFPPPSLLSSLLSFPPFFHPHFNRWLGAVTGGQTQWRLTHRPFGPSSIPRSVLLSWSVLLCQTLNINQRFKCWPSCRIRVQLGPLSSALCPLHLNGVFSFLSFVHSLLFSVHIFVSSSKLYIPFQEMEMPYIY